MGDILMRGEFLSVVEGDGVHEVADRLEATHGCLLCCAGGRTRNTEGSRASPQAYRRLRAHHHLRQRKGIRRASGYRPCTENQNLLRHAVSRMGARFK